MAANWLPAYEDKPNEKGWYPILECWDPEEGTLPSAYYWNGNEWENTFHPIYFMFLQTRFDEHGSAYDCAFENDPDI